MGHTLSVPGLSRICFHCESMSAFAVFMSAHTPTPEVANDGQKDRCLRTRDLSACDANVCLQGWSQLVDATLYLQQKDGVFR